MNGNFLKLLKTVKNRVRFIESKKYFSNNEVPLFPGARTTWTEKMEFTGKHSYAPIPVYRVMDRQGNIINSTNEPALSNEILIKMYKDMLSVGLMDKILYEAQRQGRISFYLTNFGEEATQVGSAAALSPADVVYGQYREVGVLMWRGFTFQQFVDQCYGNKDDPGKGKQMPVHYGSTSLNFVTISSPLSTQIPQAVGSAYTLRGKNKVVACYFGDGGASEGDTHAAFNFAATLDCPVLFLCRNNGYAISTPVDEQYRGDGIAARGPGYGINTIRVDGNDILAVYNVTKMARDYAVKENKPVLIEAMTYRVGHHTTSDDSTAYRKADEVEQWSKNDYPTDKFRFYLSKKNLWDDNKDKEWIKEAKQSIMEAFRKGEDKHKHSWEVMFDEVYKYLPEYIDATTGAYQAGQAGYAVAAPATAAAAATYGTQRPTGYDTAYQAAAATPGTYAAVGTAPTPAYEYGYGQNPATGYTSGYDQTAAAAAAAAAAAKPGTYAATYTQRATTQQAQQVANAAAAAAAAKPATYTATYQPNATAYQATYAQPAAQTTIAAQPTTQAKQQTNSTTTYSGYDAALYSAATMYVAQQNNSNQQKAGGWQNYKKTGIGGKNIRTKAPPKPQQLHYCDVCKISCAGPQTYKEHLEGQKHKKREAATKMAASVAVTNQNRAGNSLRCQLCDVTCTGNDAYAAHIRGAKHQKVVLLHTKLGKPIPSQEPEVIGGAKKSISSTPKINFVQSGGLGLSSGNGEVACMKDDEEESLPEPDIQPVGQDYIEEIKSDDGKVISFNCKICECRFNDPNAKEMHMKGRRHRLQYKKKVNPDLVVDVKPSLRQRKIQEDKMRRAFFQGGVQRRTESSDDKHVMARHAEIYPKEEELQAIQRIVSHTERALKLVSDNMSDVKVIKTEAPVKTEDKQEQLQKEDGRDNQLFSFQQGDQNRVLKGVMRVGHLAKGLLLCGDTNVELVVLCADKPTLTLLKKVVELLPAALKQVAPENAYTVAINAPEAGLIIAGDNLTVLVQFTSPVIREQQGGVGLRIFDQPCSSPPHRIGAPPNEKGPFLVAKARALGLHSCVIIIRILRDLCQRVPTWSPLSSWAMELLAEKVISSVPGSSQLSPGDALRRVMEAVASGLLLPGGPGLADPCEKDNPDASGALSAQQREDLTCSAQYALRLIAYRQIYKVLGMDPIPMPQKAFRKDRVARKRRRSGGDLEGSESDSGKMVKTEGAK
ncbi:unnamed protein product [Phyllotreta striolata]|uniref:2-oxoisovalerate dehydrogenase subunit alpha, mitochondrial n=1 Tax=Phyllotreta striolata TaxID=444603 RepID=A0A9N9TZM5_PHYSR|nr:unnamed protein product [Phyllotreta striolata]